MVKYLLLLLNDIIPPGIHIASRGLGIAMHYFQNACSNCGFKRLVLQTHKNQGLFGKGLDKLNRNDYGMALFRNYSKNLIPIKTQVTMVTNFKRLQNL